MQSIVCTASWLRAEPPLKTWNHWCYTRVLKTQTPKCSPSDLTSVSPAESHRERNSVGEAEVSRVAPTPCRWSNYVSTTWSLSVWVAQRDVENSRSALSDVETSSLHVSTHLCCVVAITTHPAYICHCGAGWSKIYWLFLCNADVAMMGGAVWHCAECLDPPATLIVKRYKDIFIFKIIALHKH